MASSFPSSISALVAQLEEASYAYHNGLDLLMTDAEFDAGVERLKSLDPKHPFLKKVGAPVPAALKAQEVVLPIPMPSLNKPKTEKELTKWLRANPAPLYHISVKLDGCSALWVPATGKLYTRGDGIKGRDISAFAPHIRGLVRDLKEGAGGELIHSVRGELVIPKDSPVIPEGMLGRNIVAGFLNTPKPIPANLKHVHFVAYQHLVPGESESQPPSEEYELLSTVGFEMADSTEVKAKEVSPSKEGVTLRQTALQSPTLSPATLTEILDSMDADCAYSIDGIVVTPDVAGTCPRVRSGKAINPSDQIAWKVRGEERTATTTVRAVEWNISRGGYLIPIVQFDPVNLSGATISAATGLHGRWIYENEVGPGAEIEIRRSGDVIPQITAVLAPAPGGAAMPALYKWVDSDGASVGSADSADSAPAPSASSVHIKPVGAEYAAAFAQRKLTHALKELGAENVGPGIVAKLYAGGLTDLKAIYSATPAEIAALEGFGAKGADRVWAGLRVGQAGWTELNFLVASCTMPRGVGHTKLTPLLELQANPAHWPRSSEAIKAARPPGISVATIDAIVAAVPAYLEWRAATGLHVAASPAVHKGPKGPTDGPQMTVVFTGVRDKAMEAALVAAGHVVGASVTKKTTHVVHADGADTETGKLKKARETGATIMSLSEMRALLSL